jgi:transcriptional regulator with XRE-family HTH domain
MNGPVVTTRDASPTRCAVDMARASSLEIGARLRQYRKSRKLTLSKLADAIGTTPQTVQRLETGNMTISLDWLFKISFVLGVDPIALFETEGSSAIPVIGTLGRSNKVQPVPTREQSLVTLGGLPRDYIAVRLSTDVADYFEGDILVASPVNHRTDVNVNWGHCLVGTETEMLRLMHVVRDKTGEWLLVSPGREQDVQSASEIKSLAQIVCVIRHVAAGLEVALTSSNADAGRRSHPT